MNREELIKIANKIASSEKWGYKNYYDFASQCQKWDAHLEICADICQEYADSKWVNVDRLEIINHSSSKHDPGRLLVFRKELGHFDNLEFQLQDDGRTLKIFTNPPKQ